MKIRHVFHDPETLSYHETRRAFTARGTWHTLRLTDPDWYLLPHRPILTAKLIGDPRPLPLINDLLDYGCEQASEDDAVLWTNIDCCVGVGAGRVIRKSLATADCCFGHRIDVSDASRPADLPWLMFQEPYGGVDLLAFRPAWWRSIRDRLPKMYVACEAFDGVLMHEMLASNPNSQIAEHVLYHECHDSPWMIHRLTSPANLHNRAMGRKWCLDNGRGVPGDWGE